MPAFLKRHPSFFLYISLAIGALLYIALRNRFYVGFFNDDSMYITLAEALTGGHYARIPYPMEPPLTDPLPGFPLFLIPFINLLGSPWGSLRWVSIAISLLSIAGLWRLSESVLSKPFQAGLVILYALNPVTALYSGTVLSEPLYSCISIWTWIGVAAASTGGRGAGLGALAGFASWVRPQGILLILFSGAQLATLKKKTIAGFFAVIALAIWLGWVIRNHSIGQESVGYSSHWRMILDILSRNPGLLIDHAREFFRTLIQTNLLAINTWPSNLLTELITWSLTGSAIALMVCGFWKRRSTHGAMGLYVLSFVLLHLSWLVVDDRYYTMLTPFLLLGLAMGLETLWKRQQKAWTWVFTAVIAGSAIFLDGVYIAQTQRGPSRPLNRFPEQTFEWIRQETPEDARLMGPSWKLYLYTHRKTWDAPIVNTPNEALFALRQMGVTYVVDLPRQLLSFRSPNASMADRERMLMNWISQHPEFKEVYRNDAEGTHVYRFTTAVQKTHLNL